MRANHMILPISMPMGYYSTRVGTEFKQEPNPKKFGELKNQKKSHRRGGNKRR